MLSGHQSYLHTIDAVHIVSILFEIFNRKEVKSSRNVASMWFCHGPNYIVMWFICQFYWGARIDIWLSTAFINVRNVYILNCSNIIMTLIFFQVKCKTCHTLDNISLFESVKLFRDKNRTDQKEARNVQSLYIYIYI